MNIQYTFEEIRLGLEIYEKFLIQETSINNKTTLNEINLNFKGVKDLPQKALKTFKSFSNLEKTFVGLLGKIKKETNKDAKEIVNFIRKKSQEYKGKSLKDIQADTEKLVKELLGKPLKEDDLQKDINNKKRFNKIGGLIALTIYISLNLIPSVFQSATAITSIDNPPSIENPISLDSGGNDPDVIDYEDALSFMAVDNSYSDVKNAANSQNVNIDLGDIGGSLSFDTGEFDADIKRINTAAIEAYNNLVKSLNGKDIESINIDPFGMISNTPGDQDNNPNGPDKDGLDQKRLEVAKKIAEIVKRLIQKNYPDAEVTITDGVVNGNSVSNQKEVTKGSKEAKNTQSAGVTFSDIQDTQKDTEPVKTKTPPTLARLIDPKMELSNTSRFRALIALFLPLLIDDYEKVMKKASISLQLDDKDFPITRNIMEKKRQVILAKQNKDENDILALKILNWAIGISKRPESLRTNINNLDPKVALGKRKLQINTTPGKRGTNVNLPGSGQTQGNTGLQATSPATGKEVSPKGQFKGTQVGESLLQEISTDFNELPNYNESKAKSNLGILVPLYSAFWASEPSKIASGDILPMGFDIDYVMDTYKDSWRKFEKDYPVISGKTDYETYIDYIPGEEQQSKQNTKQPGVNKTQSTSKSFDKNPNISPDTQRVKTSIDRNSTLIKQLDRINNKEELQKLILAILFYTNKDFIEAKSRISRAIFTARNRFKPIKESTNAMQKAIASLADERNNRLKIIDVLRISKYLNNYPTLQNLLNKINTEEELIDLILDVILPHVNPVLHKQPSIIKGALIGAGNQFTAAKPGEELKMFKDNVSERKLSKKVEKFAKDLPDNEFKRRYGKDWKSVKIATAQKLAEILDDPVDTINMDIPLFLRALEYAKEDAQSDMDLHDFTEKAIALAKTKNPLTMNDYISLINEARTKKGKKVNPNYLKGLKSKGEYGSKEAMKKEIDKFSGKDTYKKDWKADYGDDGKRIKTKPSAATKKYKEMFGESLESLLHINENSDKALKNKAKKSKIPLSILRAVYSKGKAAWNTGHRPGTSQDQWAMGRVNSFITGSGGARKADAKLWARAKKARAKKTTNNK